MPMEVAPGMASLAGRANAGDSAALDELLAELRPQVVQTARLVVEGRQFALKQAFDRLPPRLRATAVLRLQIGLSEAETAAVLGSSVGAVKSNLHDARKRLTEMLTQAGYAPAVERRKGERDDHR